MKVSNNNIKRILLSRRNETASADEVLLFSIIKTLLLNPMNLPPGLEKRNSG